MPHGLLERLQRCGAPRRANGKGKPVFGLALGNTSLVDASSDYYGVACRKNALSLQ